MRGGANLPIVSSYNRSLVLAAIRIEPSVSRVELARLTGLAAQTVSNIVRRLLDDGLVVEVGQGPSRGGKPRTLLALNAQACYAVGIQVDPHDVVYLVTDLRGTVLARSHTAAGTGGPSVSDLVTGVAAIIAAANVPAARIVGIGVAVPGPVDVESGVVVAPPNMREWHGLQLRATLEQETGLPVTVDNDASAAAIGLHWAGDTNSARNFACLYFGTGIGSGLFIDGQIYRGSTRNAGEWGHMTVAVDGPDCRCGNRGCLELYATPRAVVEYARQRINSGARSAVTLHGDADLLADYAALSRMALAGDALAGEAIDRAARYVAAGTVSLLNVLDLELLVLCGPALTDVGERYVSAVRAELSRRTLARASQTIEVRLSPIGSDAAALGAASLPLHRVFAPRLTGLRESDAKDRSGPGEGLQAG